MDTDEEMSERRFRPIFRRLLKTVRWTRSLKVSFFICVHLCPSVVINHFY